MSAKAEQVAKDVEIFLNSITERIISINIRLTEIEQARYENN